MIRISSYFLAGAFLMILNALPSASGAQTLGGDALLKALRSGGYVIVFRHGATEAKPDSANVNIADCTTQRNLSPDGREMAQQIGRSIGAQHIPIGTVISSPFCRATDTAELAFGHFVRDAGLGDHAVKDEATKMEVAAALRQIVAVRVPARSNTIVVTHGFNLLSVVGDDFAEGEAAIFKPDGMGGSTLVARVLPPAWAKL